jgi:hypothetical protein
MKNFARRLTVLFSAGCVGGAVNSLALWLLGYYEVTTGLGVDMTPQLTPSWLYPRIVWGGLWGFLFLLPFHRQAHFLRGVLFSLGPSLAQLFVVFPFKAHDGWFGLKLGAMTPLLVLFLNALWGLGAVLWLRFINERP